MPKFPLTPIVPVFLVLVNVFVAFERVYVGGGDYTLSSYSGTGRNYVIILDVIGGSIGSVSSYVSFNKEFK